MSLRILFATHGPPDPATAVFRTVSSRADYLRRLGHAVDVISPADFFVGRWTRVQPILLPLALAARDLGQYDVVILHSYLAWAHILRSLPRRKPGRPSTVVAFHGLEPLYHKAVAAELKRTGERLSSRFRLLHTVLVPTLLKFGSSRADRVFCLNSQERAFLVGSRWAEPARVVLLPNGVPRDLLQMRRSYSPEARRMLFTGQWLRAKGIRYVAAAFERIAETMPHTELTCIGTGIGPDVVLSSFAAAHHHRIRVLPRVNPEQLAAELAAADVFMLPSLSEGFSGALIEAMACGLPVIATPAGGAADLLTNDVNGFIVPFADSGALADAAVRLIPDQARRARLGGAARQTAQQYEWDAVNRAFAAEIDRLAPLEIR
jgi:glycosyltransferase involved in cell wall biosynthesis